MQLTSRNALNTLCSTLLLGQITAAVYAPILGARDAPSDNDDEYIGGGNFRRALDEHEQLFRRELAFREAESELYRRQNCPTGITVAQACFCAALGAVIMAGGVCLGAAIGGGGGFSISQKNVIDSEADNNQPQKHGDNSAKKGKKGKKDKRSLAELEYMLTARDILGSEFDYEY